MSVHVFGIRHHGPGSARSLCQALEGLRPDCVLIEGPPDADAVIPLAGQPGMRPPVSLLVYASDDLRHAAFYPFAVFSPEWQAIVYALARGIAVRFMDLPQRHRLALQAREVAPPNGVDPAVEQPSPEQVATPREDPLGWLAQAAGYADGERWWGHMVEERRDSAELFAAILEAMAALRENAPPDPDPVDALREPYMRRIIRAAEKDGHERIAVVCGAWHAPALVAMPPAREDDAVLKGLPAIKVEATWAPWTHGRLSYHSGYGAGIDSPGWYEHLWSNTDDVSIRWLTRVASLLRAEDLDASAAHIIEGVRLADTLAALRGRPLAGLQEMDEAIQAVFCFGSDLPMRLIHNKLIVGETLGAVPADTPMAPLQQDLQREQRRLRLLPDATAKTLDLDLRRPTDLDRSRLLHRLVLLRIPWGQTERVTGKSGTFHELWQLQWKPEFAVDLIEAGTWGATIPDAATARTRDLANRSSTLPPLTTLLRDVLLASLPSASAHVIQRIEDEAALAADVGHLMEALPALADTLRYGDVRNTDADMVRHVVDGLVARMCVGLPSACTSLDDEAAGVMFQRLVNVHHAILILRRPDLLSDWQAALAQLSDARGVHGLVAGRCCRLLLDMAVFSAQEAVRRLGLELSIAAEPAQTATWVEGFLRSSGLILVHDRALWLTVDSWVTSLSFERFAEVVPLLRRTFSTFSGPERRQLGELARQGPSGARSVEHENADFDLARAEAVLPLIASLLGVKE